MHMNNTSGKIHFFFEDVDQISFKKNLIKKWIHQVIKTEGSTFGFINIIFCSDNYLLELNKNYLNHDYYTDIITFDNTDNQVLNTDLFISVERVLDNSKKLSIEFKKELFRVIIHGILHVLGYKDKTKLQQNIMRKKEDFYLELLYTDIF
jgi:probable rRNA maturation factor